MKKLLLIASLVLTLIIAFSISPSTTDASTTRVVYKVTANTVDVKSTAQDTAKKVITAKKNEYVTVLSTTKEWSRVLFKGKKGYVKTSLLTKAKATNKQVTNIVRQSLALHLLLRLDVKK